MKELPQVSESAIKMIQEREVGFTAMKLLVRGQQKF
jgi:hypothetical protein